MDDAAARADDIAYLLNRATMAGMAGRFSCNAGRWWGASSNALVLFAYTGIKPTDWPRDRADYAACVRAVRMMPRHRRTADVMEMLGKAKERYLAEDASRTERTKAHLAKGRQKDRL